MSLAEDLLSIDDTHPIDLVELLAADHQWQFDRVTENQIAMMVEGLWRSYALTLAWSPGDETLRLVCTFELDPPADRMAQLHDVLNRANDQVWTGAFAYWAEQRLMVWRYGLSLAGGQIAGAGQLDHMIASAITGCERYYPAFQMVCWTGASPEEAMKVAIAEAYGRA